MLEHPDTRGSAFCQACAVRNRAICADLDSGEIAALNAIGRRRKLEQGEPLLWEGDDAVLVANVVDGVLKLSSGRADGREQILGIAYPSDFIGRPFAESTPYSVEALTEATVCVFPRADFDRFARDHPRLEHKLLERTLAELDRTRRWMTMLGRMSAEQKLASFLIEMEERVGGARTCAGPTGGPFVLPLDRQQIADLLGLTIETVSRQFARLRREGLIETPSRREVTIRDRSHLALLAQ